MLHEALSSQPGFLINPETGCLFLPWDHTCTLTHMQTHTHHHIHTFQEYQTFPREGGEGKRAKADIALNLMIVNYELVISKRLGPNLIYHLFL